MEEKTIILNYRRKDFEDIFFKNGNDKTLFHKKFNTDRNVFAVILIGSLCALAYQISTDDYTGFLFFLAILLCWSGFNWYSKAVPTIKWKKEVITYLNSLDAVKVSKIVFSEGALSIIQDEKQTTEKWAEFNRVEINENFISLYSNSTNYLLPKNSVSEEDFLFIRQTVTEKTKRTIKLLLISINLFR